ncbi:cGMP-dependent 3',5'-cyclic phosphodiesterase [Orchesella cincta]|uniref:Phosphodiesterase n=1 Tax=Orchesella cincta TaxID=48709 RepID=A0A1D2N9L9_ORCCI|nr:cGMP-dependent 3',5'-cyclic phosphodiesterase [Orchesella cincta]
MKSTKQFSLAGAFNKIRSSRPNTSPLDDTTFRLNELMSLRQLPKGPKLQQLLRLFRGESTSNIHHQMSDFIKSETRSDEVQFLRMYGEEFEVVNKSTLQKIVYSCKKTAGMPEAIYKRLPVLLEKTATASWKGILREQPEYLIIIPVTVTASTSFFIIGTAVIAYYSPMSQVMEEETTWNLLLDYLQLTVPLLINTARYEESEEKCQRLITALEALSRAERDIHDIGNCIRTMALEISSFLSCEFVQVLVLQQEIIEDKKLHKYCHFGTPQFNNDKCPNPMIHQNEDVKITTDSCVGYTALQGKPVRVNSPAELANYGIHSKVIHSVGGCIVKQVSISLSTNTFTNNILCIPISEHSGEAPLILELSQKQGGFSYHDEEQIQLFAKRAAAILSSAILLDYKKKAIRRHGIRNEVLANIGEVSFFKVKQLLDLKFQYSSSFRKKLEDFRFSMRIFPDHQSPGVILYLFMDLGFVNRWQMRKSTLIRFILSIQQGYRDIPHACCVSHFAYLLLKKLDLVKLGYITDLEALTLVISCMAHDIDHRGRNNHFNLCTKSELYHLYKQEDSIMERHHISVALSVLNTEDCNIITALNDDEYREFLDLIQWNILATDLAKYMQNRNEYFFTLTHFDPSEKIHRRHLSAVIMTTSDLCDNIKSWDTNLPCVKSIFHEFFAQGDDEIALGLKPMPMMDRRVAYIPQIEITFLNNIVRPSYQALADLLPQTKVCLQTLDYFEDLWLVSTAIFDENADFDDCLLVLDLKDMKEENLKRRSAPQLQNILVEHGIPVLSIAQIGFKPQVASQLSIHSVKPTKPSASVASDKKSHSQRRRSSNYLNPPRMVSSQDRISCSDCTKNWLCCYVCRLRGLMAARAVRKLRLEEEYLDNRVNQYERRRSIDSGTPVARKDTAIY